MFSNFQTMSKNKLRRRFFVIRAFGHINSSRCPKILYNILIYIATNYKLALELKLCYLIDRHPTDDFVA